MEVGCVVIAVHGGSINRMAQMVKGDRCHHDRVCL